MGRRGGGKDKKKTEKKNEAQDAELILEALVLADSFDSYFRPLSDTHPRTLFPLANVPLLDYVLEFLVSKNISKIYLFCCFKADMIRKYIETSRWRNDPSVLIEIIISRKAVNAGDALRELHGKGVFRNDFLVVQGDVVANVDINRALVAHIDRRKHDKECIITTLFTEAKPGHRTRSHQDDIVLAVDPLSQQLVAYETNPSTRALQVDLQELGPWGHASLDFRYDLLESGIYICAPDVLYQFVNNFDYSNVSAFVRGIVNQEILGVKAHGYVIPKGQYAARANTLGTYRSIVYDIIHRWTYPMVPDSNMVLENSYRLSKNLIYREKNVDLQHTSNIKGECVIGYGSIVGKETVISRSTLGRECLVGNNVEVTASFLWDSVVIEDNVIVKDSILGEKVCIKKGVLIPPGCVISSNITISLTDAVLALKPFSKITTISSENTVPLDAGGEREVFLWENPRKLFGVELVPTEVDLLQMKKDEEDESDSEEEELTKIYVSTRERFLSEVYETLNHTDVTATAYLETVRLEVNALKLAYDTSFLETAEAIILAMIQLHDPHDKKRFQEGCRVWVPLIEKFLDSGQRKIDELELLFKLLEFCEDNSRYTSTFGTATECLYDNKVFSSEIIEQWYTEQLQEKEDGGGSNTFLLQCDQLLKRAREDEGTDSYEEDFSMDSDDDFMFGGEGSFAKKEENETNDESTEDEDSFSWSDDDEY